MEYEEIIDVEFEILNKEEDKYDALVNYLGDSWEKFLREEKERKNK